MASWRMIVMFLIGTNCSFLYSARFFFFLPFKECH
uniref:Uncharacterized protein n=1 Tax=Anguilla anguilla TaxID=7936 RepID=A0A0E9RWW0_ANGAN